MALQFRNLVCNEDLDRLKRTGTFIISRPYKFLPEYVNENNIKLTTLGSSGCGITDSSVELICRLINLEYIDLSENHLTKKKYSQSSQKFSKS